MTITSTFLQDYGNDDTFFNDIRIAAPPVVEFGMYPPVESTPSESRPNGGRIVFEPLPDLAARRRHMLAAEAGGPPEEGGNGRQLRPRVCKLERERADSVGSVEEMRAMDSAMEKVKLDRLLGEWQY